MRRRALVVFTFVAAGCGSEPPVPDRPTWVDDVKPILEGNCFHCHGASANFQTMETVRWDVYGLPVCRDEGGMEVCTPEDSPYLALGFKADPQRIVPVNQREHYTLITTYATLTDANRMPPPPATPLSARDIEVLEKWRDAGFPMGSHRPNARPGLRWFDKRARQYEVFDGNGDQVLGKLTCGAIEVPVLRTGVSKLPDDAELPCMGAVFDGFDQVDVTLRP
jgi:hypothetical protein